MSLFFSQIYLSPKQQNTCEWRKFKQHSHMLTFKHALNGKKRKRSPWLIPWKAISCFFLVFRKLLQCLMVRELRVNELFPSTPRFSPWRECVLFFSQRRNEQGANTLSEPFLFFYIYIYIYIYINKYIYSYIYITHYLDHHLT